jgi:peptide methionine sulfoxide reductase MsrA
MSSTQARAVLATGCFWGMQDLIRRYPGVLSTRVGSVTTVVTCVPQLIAIMELTRKLSRSFLSRAR